MCVLCVVVGQFDLVCEKSYIINLSTTVYFIGVMLGGLVFGTVSDRKGRKFTILVTMYAYIVLGTVAAFVPYMTLFVALRFCIGFVLQVGLMYTLFKQVAKCVCV